MSTEDMIARLEKKNDENLGWSPTKFWDGMTTAEFKTCGTCIGNVDGTWYEEFPEVCMCEDGIDENGRIMVTTSWMKGYRRNKWELDNMWDGNQLERMVSGTDALHEDLQDVSKPMVIVGTDVINLYPSLDIKKVVGTVRDAVLESNIKWEQNDYLEGARYVALNWSEEKCRSSGLWRILPKRRCSRGTRPGLRGEGPQGGNRGDQEQWVFPHVREIVGSNCS